MANKPLLWLRMADCCMGVLQPQTQPADLHPELSGVATHIGTDLPTWVLEKPVSGSMVETCCPTLEKHTETKLLNRRRLLLLLLGWVPF